MAAKAGVAFVDVQGNLKPLFRQLTAASPRLRKFGAAGAVGLGLTATAAVAAGKALYDIGQQFDDSYDTITQQTGATGKQLKGLKKDFKQVVTGVPVDFKTAADAVAGLNQRLDLTGKPLVRLSKQIAEFSHMTETDVGANIETTSRLFKDWSVSTGQQGKTLDQLFRTTQQTGIGLDTLSSLMVQFGSPLRQLGLGFDFASAMFASFEKEGVNIQTLMPGLRFALKNFSGASDTVMAQMKKWGLNLKDPSKALEEVFAMIKKAPSDLKANQIAFEIFGARAGPDMAAAVREGRFSISALMKEISGGDDTILKAAHRTADFTEQWQLFKNRVMVTLEPAATKLFDVVGKGMKEVGEVLTDKKLDNGEKFSKLFDMAADAASDAMGTIASKVGEYAPKAAEAFVKGFINSNAWGKLVIGGLLLSKLGGRRGAIGAGSSIGQWLGIGIASGVGGKGGKGGKGGAAGGIAGSLMGGLKNIKWARVGAVGVGLGIAESISEAIERGMRENSDNLLESLEARTEGIRVPIVADLTEFLGVKFPEIPMDALGIEANVEQARALELAYKGMVNARVSWDPIQIKELASKAKDLDLTQKQRAATERMLALLRQGARLKVGVDAGMDPNKLKKIYQGFQFLKKGVGTTTADINRVSKRNFRLVAATMGTNTKEGRKLVAENMRATAAAMKQQMKRGGDFTQAGMKRVKEIIRNANLKDPSRKQAQAFGREWARGMDQSKEVTRKGVQAMIREANKMPGPMRRIALQTWLDQAKEAKRSGDITTQQFRNMRSRVLSEFGNLQRGATQKGKGLADGVIGNVTRMVNTTSAGLGVFRDNVNAALGKYGVEAQEFTLKVVDAPGKQSGGYIKRQRGGFTVPGVGDGDSFRTVVPPGSFVLNKKATRHFGFQRGGAPVALEPGERVFYPEAVKQIGQHNLESANRAVPRFAKGGAFGVLEPKLSGPDPLGGLGRSAIKKVYKGGMDYLRKHSLPPRVMKMFKEGKAEAAKGYDYVYGGGHGALGVGPFDCSGFVSAILGAGNFISTPMAVAQGSGLYTLGEGGDGKFFTWGVRGSSGMGAHTMIKVKGPGNKDHYFESGSGHGAAEVGGWSGAFEHRHMPGFQRGGRVPEQAKKAVQKYGAEATNPHSKHFVGWGYQLGGAVRALAELAKGGWAKTGYTIYSGSGQGAGGNLQSGKGYAELGTANQDGSGTGQGYIAKLLGMSGELPMGYGLDVKIGSKIAQLFKKDRGYGQGTPAYSIDIHSLAWGELGLSEANGKGTAYVRPSDGSGAGGKEEKVPAIYRGCRTDDLSFPSMPKTLKGVDRELNQRRAEIPRYRKAAKAAGKEGKKQTQHALELNVTALEARIRELSHERAKLRREIAKKKITKRLSKALLKITGMEGDIEARERIYNRLSQDAEQIVGLEPVQPELPGDALEEQREASEKSYVAQLAAYVNDQERPAYTRVLAAAANWRNIILKAETKAAGPWQDGKGVGGIEGHWEDKILVAEHEIAKINSFSDKVNDDVGKYKKEHPKKAFPDWLKDEIKERHQQLTRLPILLFKERELRQTLGEGRESFYPGMARIKKPVPPIPGSGSFEEALENVQGIHWPDQHDIIGSLPGNRVAGMFGGAVWDTQEAIEGLGLKISQAASGIGTGSETTEEDDGTKALLEQLVREANERTAVSQAQYKVFKGFKLLPNFGGIAHTGAVVPGPASAERTMIVRGREAIFTAEQTAALGGMISEPSVVTASGGPPVKVIIEEGAGVDPSKVRTEIDRRGRRDARTAGRSLPGKAGIF